MRSVSEHDWQIRKSFLTGKTKNFINHWRHITSDQNILQPIRGYKIGFTIKDKSVLKLVDCEFPDFQESHKLWEN